MLTCIQKQMKSFLSVFRTKEEKRAKAPWKLRDGAGVAAGITLGAAGVWLVGSMLYRNRTLDHDAARSLEK
jgi:hypothetical protein